MPHEFVVANQELKDEIRDLRREIARLNKKIETIYTKLDVDNFRGRVGRLGDRFETKMALGVLDIKIFSAGITMVAFGALLLTKFLR